MKPTYFTAMLAGLALSAVGNAFAVTDLGVLSPANPITFSQESLADNAPFSDAYSFTLDNAGISLVGIVGSVYSDSDSKITGFSAALTKPDSTVVSFDLNDIVDGGFGYQYLVQALATAPLGSYGLVISGTTATYAATYTIDLSVSAVPEPASMALMLAGLGLVGFVGSRRKSA